MLACNRLEGDSLARRLCTVLSVGFVLVFVSNANAGQQIAAVNDTVHALVTWQDDLIAAGNFTVAGSQTVQHIARWDGDSWHSIGGTDGPIYALAAFDSLLVVGGHFTNAGGVAANNVATWDGLSWSNVGSGTNGPVHAVATLFGLFIYAGGSFDQAGGAPANNVAEWFNGSWKAMGDGLDGVVENMLMMDATVVAAGDFQIAGRPIGDRQIASFSPTGWVPENQAIQDGLVHAVADANGTLIMGGEFDQVWWQTRGISVGRQVGPRWQPLSIGLSQGQLLNPGQVFALTAYAGGIAAGGLFSLADGLVASNVAFHDGSVWTPLGAGVDGPVFALTEYQGDLIVGGSFSAAGSVPATGNIAAWSGIQWLQLPPMALNDLRIDSRLDGVHLTWRLPAASLSAWNVVSVQRATDPTGPYTVLSEKLVLMDQMTWHDTSIEPDRVYWYRLLFESDAAEPGHVGPVRVETQGPGGPVGMLAAFDPGGDLPVQIRYRLGRSADVRLQIFDARGRVVRMLESGALPAGEYVRSWDRYDQLGHPAARGVYFVHLDAGRTRSSRRLILLSR